MFVFFLILKTKIDCHFSIIVVIIWPLSELKAALPRRQRSPGGKRVNLGELTPCSEDLPEGAEGEWRKRLTPLRHHYTYSLSNTSVRHLTCTSCAFTAKSREKKDSTDQTDSTTVTNSKSEQSPSGPSEQVTNQERRETVSDEHTTQGETSDQRTESPSPETHMD